MTFGTRSTGSTSNQCQNVTIHNVSTIKLTKSLNARASAEDDRKDTDLSSQAEVDTVEETESSEAPAARDGAGSTDTDAAEQVLRQDSDGDEETSEAQEDDTDGATATGSGSDAPSGVGPDDASGTEADVLVLAAAPGRDEAEAPEILLEGLQPPSSTALEDLDINALVTLLPSLGFSGAQDSVVRLPSSSVTGQGYRGPATILVVGVGTGWADTDPLAVITDDEAALGYDQTGLLRRAAGRATRALAGTDSAVLALPALCEEQLAAVVHGAALGAYSWSATKNEDRPTSKWTSPLKSIFIVSPLADTPEGQEAMAGALALAQATALTRDLVNEPPNRLTPQVFAERARAAGQAAGIRVEIWDAPALVEQGFGGILGVAQGSVHPARLVRLEWSPVHATEAAGGRTSSQAEGDGAAGRPKHVALIGKGITFDSGGLSLKPASSMPEMKSDMAGAATVLGAIVTAARLALPIRVTAWLALAENMPGADAQRPSDVITMFDGTTVEVTNTDAEGRLVMADALARAVTEEPDAVLDVATLTGAQIVALGDHVAAVMGTPDLREEVVAAAQRAGESFWPMPLPAHLRATLDSPFADLRNTKVGSRAGGMLSAGLFLREFVGRRPWAHLDIAGPAYNDSSPWGLTPTGGTGMGVSTLVELLRSLSAEVSILS
ncbi:leucyl aminopeptidase [Actinomyces oris]|uniref:Probable cytosol aminopeptidase n=1 Tax=Actinomyces oris TaxID=544580 RepID=A0AAW9L0B1_9ACTO|nr:leucyl aminopeptidase [Actinomyces oris]MEA1304441.1 leucyl aminopeptidase [Actinomyces oris]OLO59071.1 leucyl aminopeptidase [Actinomyces oris]